MFELLPPEDKIGLDGGRRLHDDDEDEAESRLPPSGRIPALTPPPPTNLH